jgi:hypothetical protein
MLKRFVMSGLLGISMVVMLMSEAKAQPYSYIGGQWKVNTYTHSMIFKVPGNVFNQNEVFFVSDTVWYDNEIICKTLGGNITFVPGIGHITLEGSVQVFLQSSCADRGQGGACSGEVVYFNSVAELENDPNLLLQCQDAVGDTTHTLTAQRCFLRFFNLENVHCRNKNDTPVEVRTKGVCTTATAETCTDPTNPSTCTVQNTQGVRYTYPNFNPPPLTLFNMALDDNCVACVLGTGPCTP